MKPPGLVELERRLYGVYTEKSVRGKRAARTSWGWGRREQGGRGNRSCPWLSGQPNWRKVMAKVSRQNGGKSQP